MPKKKKSSAGAGKRGGRKSPTTSSSNSSLSSAGKKEATKSRPKSRKQADSFTDRKKRSSVKAKRNSKAEAPFPLYQDVSNADISEGFESIVNLLRGRKNIVVLTGAGISVSCGIPDFRSKGSGLYSTLNHEDLGLSCPEELFDWEIFKEDPRPFYKFAKQLYFPLGNDERVRPSDSHKLLALLEQRKMLLRVYSQNIDGLEQVAGVSTKRMVYAHGSLQWATCCKCKRKVEAKEIEPAILQRTVPLCQEVIRSSSRESPNKRAPPAYVGMQNPTRAKKRPRVSTNNDFVAEQQQGKPNRCNGVLKPGVTFFGEALNDTVRKSLESDRNKVDALIVIGTSLSVAPMSKVIGYLPANIPRILINRNIVHPKSGAVGADEADDDDSDDEERDFREGYVFDAYLLGYCDDITRTLARKLFTEDTTEGGGRKSESEDKKQTHCQLLATIRKHDSEKHEDEDEDDSDVEDDDSTELVAHKAPDWSFCTQPEERVVLFPGAEPSKGNSYGDDGEEDANSEVTFREIAHCDGCSKRIVGTIQKCVECFDYDLCQRCFPKLSKPTTVENTLSRQSLLRLLRHDSSLVGMACICQVPVVPPVHNERPIRKGISLAAFCRRVLF